VLCAFALNAQIGKLAVISSKSAASAVVSAYASELSENASYAYSINQLSSITGISANCTGSICVVENRYGTVYKFVLPNKQ